MTSKERIDSLYDSLEYIRENNLEGDFVECGVWKGGNILGIITYLQHHSMQGSVWLFDTFSGMTLPGEMDIDFVNRKASNIFEDVKCASSLDSVKWLLDQTKFNKSKINYVVGDVEKTLVSKKLPAKISLLRLDTDWYASTKKELEVLYPILCSKGVLIVDDYGHWQGAKKAVDEYFLNSNVIIEKIDYTGIKLIKK